METHDFTAAKVGDKVSHPIYGCGVIVVVKPFSEYYLTVAFEGEGAEKLFYIDGRYTRYDKSPSLYHGHNTFQIIATPVSPYKEGEWIAVKTREENIPALRKFVKMDKDGVWCEVFDGPTESYKWPYHKSLTELNAELNNK